MFTRIGGLLLAVIVSGSLSSTLAQEKVVGPVRVKIQDEKPAFFEANAPIDPVKRVEFRSQGNMYLNVLVEGKALHIGTIQPVFKVDQTMWTAPVAAVGAWMQMEIQQAPLPKTPSGKERDGFMSVGKLEEIRVTQTVEVVATRADQGKLRRRDAVVVRYVFENKDAETHQVGLRCIINSQFAAPDQSGKILNGVELKDKTMPDYLQVLGRPILPNPGHLTFNLGTSVEAPNRAVLTSPRAVATGDWDLKLVPIGNLTYTTLGLYWDPRPIKPGARREFAYALGQGLATKLEGEGTLKLDLIGSFEPNKMFTINAFVSDPAPGQSLTLELPDGLERLEGKETQPVPAVDDEGNCLIQWKARLLRPGQYNLRVHSTTGVTQTKIVTVTKEQSAISN